MCVFLLLDVVISLARGSSYFVRVSHGHCNWWTRRRLARVLSLLAGRLSEIGDASPSAATFGSSPNRAETASLHATVQIHENYIIKMDITDHRSVGVTTNFQLDTETCKALVLAADRLCDTHELGARPKLPPFIWYCLHSRVTDSTVVYEYEEFVDASCDERGVWLGCSRYWLRNKCSKACPSYAVRVGYLMSRCVLCRL